MDLSILRFIGSAQHAPRRLIMHREERAAGAINRREGQDAINRREGQGAINCRMVGDGANKFADA